MREIHLARFFLGRRFAVCRLAGADLSDDISEVTCNLCRNWAKPRLVPTSQTLTRVE